MFFFLISFFWLKISYVLSYLYLKEDPLLKKTAFAFGFG